VPRIPDQLQRSIVFIYPTADAAVASEGAGGTGFLVAIQGARRPEPFFHLITNTHVACSEPRFLRIKTTSGEADVVRIEGTDWVNHSDGDDVAVSQLERKPHWDLDAIAWSDMAVTPGRLGELNVGVGDEVFMLGRFVAHQGKQRTQPLARFGSIAMMPGEPVVDGRGFNVEAFLVEMRSLSGFSGSPVFVHIAPGTYRGNGTMMPFYSEAIGLLGIDAGHKTLRARVVDRRAGQATDLDVDLNTGISIVVPVWKIKQVLNDERFIAIRGAAVPERS
jgi:hypothetical protein